MIKTYKSEDARLKLRDILDDVMTGRAESIIERHGKPTAVVISYAQWQAWQRQRSAQLLEIREEWMPANMLPVTIWTPNCGATA